MLIKRPTDIRASEITSERLYRRRRDFLRGGAAVALGAAVSPLTARLPGVGDSLLPPAHAAVDFNDLKPSPLSTDEEQTEFKAVTTYNNFYEFSTDKDGPAVLSKNFRTRPWTVAIEGEIKHPKTWDIDELIKRFPLEERVYRLRCVEAWSMVIPWVAFPLGELIKTLEPTSRAKYVEFTTLYDPEQMPGQRPGLFGSWIEWPYIEGLRIDEAVHPLSVLAVGLYGKVMPNQNGAPIRLIVPWKYGFKSIKSVVRIRFVEEQPVNTWQKQAPNEYGFYANVNPEVDHPRWSQAKERRVGDFLKRETLYLNGYAEQVAHLYDGMDPKKLF